MRRNVNMRRVIVLLILLAALIPPARAAYINFGVAAGGVNMSPVVSAALVNPSTPAVNTAAVGTPTVLCGGIACSGGNALTNCTITAGNVSGDFAISSSTCAITFTSQGATDWPGTLSLQTTALTVQATNSSGSGSGAVTVNGYADGGAAPPTGSIQYPTILNGYSHKPAWQVAGVNYYVGVPTGTTLSDPSTISNGNVSCSGTTHICTINGSTATTIGNCGGSTGIDFSLDNGWEVDITSGNTGLVTIECSKFGIGSNISSQAASVYYKFGAAGGLTLLEDSFDGAGNSGGTGTNNLLDLVRWGGTGAFIVEYCSFTNAYSDFINTVDTPTAGSGSMSATIKWNAFYAYGSGSAHADAVQTWGLNASSFNVNFNADFEPTPTAGFPSASANSFVRIGDGQEFDGEVACGQTNSCVITNPTISYNTIALLGLGWANIFQTGAYTTAGEFQNLQIHDNYIDPTDFINAVFNPIFGGFAGWVNPRVYNNVNMISNGLLFYLQFNTYGSTPPTAPPLTTSLTNATDVITLNGTAPSGETITIYDSNTSLGTATSSGGTFTFTSGTLSSGAHTISASDVYGNNTGLTSITLP